MNRFGLAVILALALVLAVPASGAGLQEETEMKVKVFVRPEGIADISRQVLEFYEVTPDYFVGAVSKPVYEELVAKGYRIEVLVADVRAEAMRYDGFFHTYEQIRDTWAIIAQNHSNICVLDTLGTSSNGYLLLVMKVSDNPGVMEQEPRICFDYTIHGNENICTEFAHWALIQLVEGYGSNPDITRWVDNREIWLLPIVNPDGLVSRSRRNGNNVDLNRNYGYAWSGGGPSVFSESEVQVLYHLGRDNPMAMWSQYHSGTKRAMWPWGYTRLATMDSVIHRYEMVRYSQITGYPYCQIARGLYPVNGGSVSWYYGATGSQGYGIEVCNGQPGPPGDIDTICRANWTAMKEMTERVMWGISGSVTDSISGAPLVGLVAFDPPDWITYSDSVGYFHKNLHAGTYDLTVSANGYISKTVTGVVVPADTFVFVNVPLVPDSTEPLCALRNITCQISNSNATSAWWGLGKRDGRRFSLEKGGWASYDMGKRTPIINGPGNDFFVVEDDGDPEGYNAYVSNDWNGPWHNVGSGTGTQGYDLAAAGQSVARYVRIVDDNAGSGGFDLDAIEAVVIIAPAVVYQSQTVIDSPPGGNADGKLDPGEYADLVVTLKNIGRAGVSGVTAKLRTGDSHVSVTDSAGTFGDIGPDSVRSNNADRFVVAADAGTPREHVAQMMLHLAGTDFEDSVAFTIMVGALRTIDPIPDGPRQPPLYWAYDDVDTTYPQHPEFDWVEISSSGTRLDFPQNDDVLVVNLGSGFGPLKYYGQRYTQVSVSADGWIAAGNYTQTNYSNTSLPSASAPPAVVALNWDDLYPGYGSQGYVYYYHDAPNHRFIIEYDSVCYYDQRSIRDKYELIIYDTTLAAPSGDNVLVCQYLTANGYTSNTFGIQDPTRAIGIQCLYNGGYNRGCAPMTASRAIKYTTTDPTRILEETAGPEPVERLGVKAVANPFQTRTLLYYAVPHPGRVELSLYDGAGRKVRTVAAGYHRAGRYHVAWDGADDYGRRVAAGVYWLRLANSDGSAVTKAVKLR